jgi:DNA polymerase-1
MKLLAVDSNSILNRAYYGVRPLTTKDGLFTHAIYGFLSIVLKICDEVQPDALAFAFDLRAPTFRHLRYADYKGTRKGMPEELAQQLEPTKELIRLMGWKIVEREGYEADDVLGTLGAMCREKQAECVIATGDRDSFQLVGGGVNVRLASTKSGQSVVQMIDEAAIREKYGVTPPQMIEIKALMGDTSDNIPGVAGIGEKTALALIQTFGTVDAVYEHLDDPAIKTAVRRKLEAGRESAYLSRELATICTTVPLDLTLDDLMAQPRDEAGLYRLLERLELKSAITRLELTPPTDKSAPVEEKKEPTMPPVFGAYNDPKLFFDLIGEDNLTLALQGPTEAPTAAALLGSSLAVIDRSLPEFDSLLDSLAGQNAYLTLCDAKGWYKRSFARGLREPKLVRFDPSLAAYLLAPTGSDYSPRSLAATWSVRGPRVEFMSRCPEGTNTFAEEAYLVFLIAGLLRDELRKKDMTSLLTDVEAPLSRVLASMEMAGFSLDIEGLRRYGAELDADLEELTQRITLLAGGPFNINSPKQLGEVLFERLGLPAGRKTRTGWSTDADTLDRLRKKHPIVEEILAYRKLAKLRSTYVDGLIEKVGADGLVHTVFKQTETRTGRISSAEPNLQNIPVRTERGSRLRAFFNAQEGHVLVDADYSQIELRVLAHLSGDEAMIEAFRSNGDIHTQTAAQVFDLPESFVTPQMRTAAKAVNFGLVYGISAYSLSQDIGVSVADADRYMKAYFHTYSGVARYMDDVVARAKADGYVTTMFGRRRPLPELTAQNRVTRSFGERVARNTPIQGSAADIIKLAMVRVYERLKEEKLASRLILQVHDELIVEAPLEEAERAAAIVTEEMEHAVTLRVPLLASAKTGKNWLEAKG